MNYLVYRNVISPINMFNNIYISILLTKSAFIFFNNIVNINKNRLLNKTFTILNRTTFEYLFVGTQNFFILTFFRLKEERAFSTAWHSTRYSKALYQLSNNHQHSKFKKKANSQSNIFHICPFFFFLGVSTCHLHRFIY